MSLVFANIVYWKVSINPRTKLTVGLLHFNSLQINRVHHRTLEEFNRSEMTLYQSLQLQVRRFPVQKYNLNIYILTIFVEEIL